MQRAALYARVSTVEQTEGHSIDAQLEALRAYAKEHDLRVFQEYVDPGWSGDTEDRPAIRQLLTDARNRQFDAVLIYRFDRIFRNVRLLLNTEHDLRHHNVRIISITEATDETHEGRLQLLIKGSFAEYERAVIRERAELGRIQAAKDGKWMGGPPPFGYDRDPETSRLIINKAEARWVKQFFRWFVHERLTLQALQQRVNDRRVPTKWEGLKRPRPVNRKGWWMKRTLGRLLSKELYTGTYQYRRTCKPRAVASKDARIRPEEEWIPIKVPKIIDAQLFRRAQAQLKRNSELSPRRTNRSYLLRRLVRCGSCGRAWVAMRNNYNRPFYICSGRRKCKTSDPCTRASISATKLEPIVWENLESVLRDPALVLKRVRERLDQEGARSDKEKELHRVRKQISRARHEEERLVRAYKQGVIGLPTLQHEREETRARLCGLDQKRDTLEVDLDGWLSKGAELAAVNRLGEQILKTLPRLSYERRCDVVHELVDRVVVHDHEVEIHTVLPAERVVGLRDKPRVDCPAKQTGVLLRKGLIDPSKYVRITLFADLPPSPEAERWRRKKAAAERAA